MKADKIHKPLMGFTSPFREYKMPFFFFFSGKNVRKTKIIREESELMLKVLLTILSSHCYTNVVIIAGLIRAFQNIPSTNIK